MREGNISSAQEAVLQETYQQETRAMEENSEAVARDLENQGKLDTAPARAEGTSLPSPQPAPISVVIGEQPTNTTLSAYFRDRKGKHKREEFAKKYQSWLNLSPTKNLEACNRLQNKLFINNLQIHDCSNRGDCQFASIADQLNRSKHDTRHSSAEVREQVCKWLKDNGTVRFFISIYFFLLKKIICSCRRICAILSPDLGINISYL